MFLRNSNTKVASLFFILKNDVRAHHKARQAVCSCWDVRSHLWEPFLQSLLSINF